MNHRANNRATCFRGSTDYKVYLALLRELSPKYDCAVHAYCLMPNHIHLLLTPPSVEACSGMIGVLAFRYSRYFNKRYVRTGRLWEGRFHSCVVNTARYIIGCYRYIELNPVRGGLVRGPQGHEWSSYDVNVGRRTDACISPHAEFLALGNTADTRTRSYSELVDQVLDAEVISAIRKATTGGGRLGD